MAEVYNTIFKLKRGTLTRWAELNPILQQGEPGFAYDANLLKIGDGVTAWNDLPLINESELVQIMAEVTAIQELVGDTSVQEQIQTAIDNHKEEITNLYDTKRYEISNLPAGCVVDYDDKEIRVFCPQNTEWTKQNVGANGNADMYYMSFKAYAPKDAVSFKEGDRGVIVDEMYTFDDAFAGIDEYGRKYSICWLALASYNTDADEWSYFGKTSTEKKYIGWNYIVEWYDANGVIINSDTIRINLSNENCHYNNEPYYMGSINVNKLTQDKGDTLVLYGGSATDNL